MLLREILEIGVKQLEATSPTARLDAEVLLRHVLNISRTQLVVKMNELFPKECEGRYFALLKKRSESEPIAYIVGVREFWGLDFKVNRKVLIPRPETELIVEEALNKCQKKQGERVSVLDLGTGSGCIGISLARELSDRKIDGQFLLIDSSIEALKVAKENSLGHNVDKCISLLASDWCSAIKGENIFDFVLSNPPYVPYGSQLERDLSFEPEAALFANESGIAEIKRIIDDTYKIIKVGGYLMIEIGYNQSKLIEKFILDSNKVRWREFYFIKDLQGIERTVVLRKECFK